MFRVLERYKEDKVGIFTKVSWIDDFGVRKNGRILFKFTSFYLVILK